MICCLPRIFDGIAGACQQLPILTFHFSKHFFRGIFPYNFSVEFFEAHCLCLLTGFSSWWTAYDTCSSTTSAVLVNNIAVLWHSFRLFIYNLFSSIDSYSQSFSDPAISSDSDLRNRDFSTPWPKIISQWNTYDVLTIVDICACGL
jgi:hypothetical protein